MTKTCSSCGKPFEAKRRAAKFCGDRCRKRAQRRPGAKLLTLPQPDAVDGELASATQRSLSNAGRLDSELAAAALLLARRLDAVASIETGAGVAALMKEYRATLADALKDAEADDDELDEIRGSAALKLLRGGRRGA